MAPALLSLNTVTRLTTHHVLYRPLPLPLSRRGTGNVRLSISDMQCNVARASVSQMQWQENFTSLYQTRFVLCYFIIAAVQSFTALLMHALSWHALRSQIPTGSSTKNKMLVEDPGHRKLGI
jgi:hypothetical protein